MSAHGSYITAAINTAHYSTVYVCRKSKCHHACDSLATLSAFCYSVVLRSGVVHGPLRAFSVKSVSKADGSFFLCPLQAER